MVGWGGKQEDKSISIWNGDILTYNTDVTVTLTQLLLYSWIFKTAFDILIVPLIA